MHRSSPEIVEEDILQRRVRPQVFVVAHSTDVVKDKTAKTTVVVAQNSRQNYGGPQGGPATTFIHITHYYYQTRGNENGLIIGKELKKI